MSDEIVISLVVPFAGDDGLAINLAQLTVSKPSGHPALTPSEVKAVLLAAAEQIDTSRIPAKTN